MMMLFSVIILMTRDVILLIPQTMSLNKRKSVKRTSGRVVLLSMNRLLSMRQLRSVELLSSRTVRLKDLRSAGLNMSLSVGLSKRFMMLRMMLSLVLLK